MSVKGMLIGAAIAAGGGAVFGGLVGHGNTAELKKQIEVLQEEMDSLHILLKAMNKAFESMHLQYLNEKAKNLIREFNENQNISSLIYAYCIKEYISLKNAILFHDYNYSENEAHFIDAFSLNIKGLTPDDEKGKIQMLFIKEYIIDKYSKEINNLIPPDTKSELEDIVKELEKYAKSQSSHKTNNKKSKKTAFLELSGNQALVMLQMQYLKIKNDIDKTKEKSTDKWSLKKHWLFDWENQVIENYGFSPKVDSADEIVKLIKKEAEATESLIWLYVCLMEADTFIPYYLLSQTDEEKDKLKIKTLSKLKFDKKDNTIDSINKKLYENKIVNFDDLRLKKIRNYMKKSDSILNENIKKGIGKAIGTVVMGALSFGLTYVFAPAIATALVGKGIAYSGIALSNHCLAVIGGGTLAAGGYGIAGGTMVIAGGGALLGTIAGGVGTTATNALLLSSSPFVLSECKKLMAMANVVIDKYTDIEELYKLLEIKRGECAQTIEILSDKKDKESKATTQELKKSLKYLKIASNNVKQCLSR